jgi:hypothetical protein
MIIREIGVILLKIPGHKTHLIRAPDAAIFGLLGTLLKEALKKCFPPNCGHSTTHCQVYSLVSVVFRNVASLSNAENWFGPMDYGLLT